MKVKDLEVGMLLRPVHEYHFAAHNDEWLWCSAPIKRRSLRHLRPIAKVNRDIAMYLGTKKDLGIKGIAWSDRYVLFQDKVLAVDPYVWRNIQPVKQ